MPHQQSAARQLRRHFITYQDMCRANPTVVRELEALWFWHKRLEAVDVYWVAASWDCYGWYQGDIYIPAITGARLSDLILGQHTRLENKPAIVPKWKFVAWLACRISRRHLTPLKVS